MAADLGFRRYKKWLLVGSLMSLAVLPVAAKSPTVQFGKNTVKVEVASTPDQIQRGLMYRTALPEDHGMVFLFSPPHGVRFWMAHCFISLDMLMIKDGKIVRIFDNVPPCKASDENQCPTYPSVDEPEIVVDQVVEVSAGYAKRHGVKTGDSVKFMLGAAVTVPSQEAAPATSTEASDGAKSDAGK